MKLPAPAKVNLHLHIRGRRADGFHDIETLMAPLTLSDEITVETSLGRTVRVECDDPSVPKGNDNLAATAAHQFARHTGRHFGARIVLEKRIPMGAGLGGGSSDAATVLVALDSIFETHLGVSGLEKLAADIGSDVPFFIRRHPAICRGRGEIIEPFDLPEKLPLLLIKPPFGVATPWAYQQWRDARPVPEELDREQDLGWTKIYNSLEKPVFGKFMLLPVLKKWLLEQPEVRAAAMSGSGSTTFAILHNESGGPALEAKVKAHFGTTLWTSLCETLE